MLQNAKKNNMIIDRAHQGNVYGTVFTVGFIQ